MTAMHDKMGPERKRSRTAAGDKCSARERNLDSVHTTACMRSSVVVNIQACTHVW